MLQSLQLSAVRGRVLGFYRSIGLPWFSWYSGQASPSFGQIPIRLTRTSSLTHCGIVGSTTGTTHRPAYRF
jgi:hypothetical protein